MGYDSGTVDQDFALLKMASKIDWASNPNIRPACLPDAAAGDYDQWMSTVTGWGTTSSGGSVSNVLLEVDVKVISNSECNAAYGGITSNMLCAADASVKKEERKKEERNREERKKKERKKEERKKAER